MPGVNAFANLPPAVQGYYDKTALLTAMQVISHDTLAEKRTLPEGEGSTVLFWKYNALKLNITALTEAVTNNLDFGGLTFATRQQLVPKEIPCIPVLDGDYIAIGRLANLRTIDQGYAEKLKRVVQMGSESFDYKLARDLAQGAMRRRADGDNNYQIQGTTSAAGSTVSIVDAARTALDADKPAIADNYYTGGYMTILSGPAYGETQQITAYTNSSGTFTTGAFSVAPGSGAGYRVVVGTNLGASAIINSRAMRQANLDLFNQKASRFEKGYFKSLLDPNIHFDFFDDPVFVKASEHKESMDGIISNEVGEFAGIAFGKSSNLYRETVAGVEAPAVSINGWAGATNGAVHCVPVCGKESFGMVSLGKSAGGGKKNMNTYIREWDQLGQPIPGFSTIGYQAGWGRVMLNGCWAVILMCGASDQLG
jgi:hypothetical protein